jgi:hypothetical protein
MAAPTPVTHGPTIDAPLPLSVKRQYSFTDFSQNNPTTPPLGNRMDAEYDRINNALNTVINFCSEVKQIVPAIPSGPQVAGADTPDLEFDYAAVTQAWAEHMPDTIPPNILAVMNVTGDHWSSRWWANRAAQAVEWPGYGEALTVVATTTLPYGTFGSVNVRNATGAPITIYLPAQPLPGQSLKFKDATGNAGTYPITINGMVVLTDSAGNILTDSAGNILTTSGGRIDGNSTYVLSSNYAAVEVFWMGDQWGTR